MRLKTYRVNITLDSHGDTTALRSLVLHVNATSTSNAPMVAEDVLYNILNTSVSITNVYVSEIN